MHAAYVHAYGACSDRLCTLQWTWGCSTSQRPNTEPLNECVVDPTTIERCNPRTRADGFREATASATTGGGRESRVLHVPEDWPRSSARSSPPSWGCGGTTESKTEHEHGVARKRGEALLDGATFTAAADPLADQIVLPAS
jgi:hypothetical protein